MMAPASDLVECVNCDCWFTAASLDDVFYHATSGCCRERAAAKADLDGPVFPQ
jgi:hypothetical protein